MKTKAFTVNDDRRSTMNAGWLMVLALSLIIYHLSFSHAVAQTFLDRLQKPAEGQGTITLHQDTALSSLVLDPQSTVKPERRENTQPPTLNSQPSTPNSQPSTPPNTSTTPNTSTPNTSTPNTQPPTPNSGRTRHVIQGYRIQAYAGGNSRQDRKNAERTANNLRTQLPVGVPVSAHFYPPRWICYVGAYRTREEAQQMLRTVKNLGYSQALIVRGKVTVYQ